MKKIKELWKDYKKSVNWGIVLFFVFPLNIFAFNEHTVLAFLVVNFCLFILTLSAWATSIHERKVKSIMNKINPVKDWDIERLGFLGYYGFYTSADKNEKVDRLNELVSEYNSKINSFNTHDEQIEFARNIYLKIKEIKDTI